MTDFRLTHPSLDFYVDGFVHERDGRHMATVDLAEDSRDAARASTWRQVDSGRRPA